MRRHILVPLIGMMLFATTASAELKVGVVDVRVVMDSVPAWGKVIKEMKAKWQDKQAKLEKRQSELKAKKEQLEAKAFVSDPQTIAREETQLLQNAQILAQQFMREQRLISAQEMDLKSQMFKRIEPLVFEIAQKTDLAFVFEMGNEQQPNVLYNSNRVDVTKKVLKAYKKTYKNKAFEVRTNFGPPPGSPGAPAGR